MMTMVGFLAGLVVGVVGACGLVLWLAPELLELTADERAVTAKRRVVDSASLARNL